MQRSVSSIAPECIVAVPAKNEAQHIGGCLAALARQTVPLSRIVLVLNDCTDGTDGIVAETAPALAVPVEVVIRDLPPGMGSAGYGRHIAMEHAARAMRGGVLLTTDADSRVPPDWVAANLRHIRGGADAVAGRAVIDPEDALLIPQQLHEDDALECAYGDLLDEIASLLDPTPWDPWPRHTEHSGASIAVRWEAYRRAGGMPATPLGEDRHFFEALARIDAKIRHAGDVAVVVSGRIAGRAIGGMADTIRRRMERPDPWLDDRLEPPADAARRARLRRALRAAWSGGGVAEDQLAHLASSLGLSGAWLRAALLGPCFGLLWDEVQARSAVLARRRVPARCVRAAIARARAIRDRLRSTADVRDARKDRVGTATEADAVPA